jgi:hypothetical protein
MPVTLEEIAKAAGFSVPCRHLLEMSKTMAKEQLN